MSRPSTEMPTSYIDFAELEFTPEERQCASRAFGRIVRYMIENTDKTPEFGRGLVAALTECLCIGLATGIPCGHISTKQAHVIGRTVLRAIAEMQSPP